MASTDYQNGTDIVLYIETNAVSYGTSLDFERTMDTRETTNKDSNGWAEFRESKKSWTASGEFIFAEDATYTYSDLVTLFNARALIEVRISSEVTGDIYEIGQALITSLPKSAPMEDNVTFSVSLQGSGPLTERTLT